MTQNRSTDETTAVGPHDRMEVDQLDLEAYVSSRLGTNHGTTETSFTPAVPPWTLEPSWMDEAIAATWPAVLAEVDTFPL